jgi:uncharacterized NAD-dependent epimerase/dehydratase family protein
MYSTTAQQRCSAQSKGIHAMDYEEAIDKQTRITEKHAISIMKQHGVIEAEWAEGLAEALIKSSGMYF